ncbi:MAG: T9SS type A sorting domain-containing protein [Chlorobi bacterium]|nr:T9SS type A sorting domain-containing protein [Chlorobiota bacterium]
MSHHASGRISLRPNISRRPRTAETNRKGFSFARRGMLWPCAQSAPRSNFLRQLIDGMPIRYVAGLVGIVASLSIVLHGEAFAQTPHASFLEPTDSSANVPLSPTIRIRTNFPIDITRLYQRGDTRTDPKQSIMVVASAFYDHLPDSLIGDGLSFGVKYTVEDDTTLSCTVGYLEYETPYVAIINNLWVITGTGDTVQVPSASVAFTTVLPPHRLESASLLFRNYIRCTDTLTFRFSRPLDSVSAGTIIKVYEFDPFDLFDLPDTVDISDINLDDLETLIPSTSWFDASKEVIYTTVPNMSTEKNYRVRVELHHLTGDSLSNRNYPFHVRTVFRLDLKAVSLEASQPLSQQPDWYPVRSGNVNIGDSIRVYAPERIGNHLFSHWSIPAIPSLDSSTANVLVIALDCETVTDVHVEAVYRPMRKGTVEVSTGTHGTVVVHSGRGESLGGEGNYTVYEGESIEVSILPDGGYTLSHWRVVGDTSDVWSVESISGNNSSSPVLTLIFNPPASSLPQSADSFDLALIAVFRSLPSSVSYGTSGKEENVAGGLRLQGIYPNPAHDLATLRFALEGNRSVSVHAEIYNGAGEVLGKVVAQRYEPGEHSILIPVRELSSGSYFVRLVVDGLVIGTGMRVVR